MALSAKKLVTDFQYESDNLVLPSLVLNEDAESRDEVKALSDSNLTLSKLNCLSTTKSTVFNYREKYILAVVKRQDGLQ